mmetsp:Transcript_48361/g.118398  ORF Transcript_48361/g.118398 Transcript_48361/m.118398 type:complete len:254 (+) Transcript_48361:258-1019(+)
MWQLAFSLPGPSPAALRRSSSSLSRECHLRPRRRAHRTVVHFDVPPGSNDPPPYWWDADPPEDPDDGMNQSLSIIHIFRKFQRSHPRATKAVVSGLLMSASDVTSQFIAARRADRQCEINFRRLFAVAVFGTVFLGPILHTWYGILDRMYPGSPSVRNVTAKVLSDQLGIAFLVNAGFMMVTGLLEGYEWQAVRSNLQQKYWGSMRLNWKVWPIGQLINFAVIPQEFQIVWVNTVGFAFTVALSLLVHEGVEN